MNRGGGFVKGRSAASGSGGGPGNFPGEKTGENSSRGPGFLAGIDR